MAHEIPVPTALGDKDLAPFFHGWRWLDDPESPVEVNLTRGTHIAPWAVTLFGAYCVWLREVRNKQVILNYEENTYVGTFLERIGLPQLLGYEVPASAASDQRICPLTRIEHSKEVAPFVAKVMSLVAIEDNEVADAVKYSLVELLRNVVQHARSRIGGVASAVYFPKSGLVDVSVADVGCGVRSALRSSYREINTDQKAVRFALQPHVSGTFHSGAYQSMLNNAGLGLFFIKEIATRSSGGFFFGSGDMLANLWGTREGVPKKRYIQSKSGGWRGTFALLQLRRATIGEFDALLAQCRDIAAEVRKSRSEFAVDFIDETPEIEGLVTIPVKPFEEDVEMAAEIREHRILPALAAEELVVLDFEGIRAATQSFIHALMYRLFRVGRNLETCLTVSNADRATEEAIRAVAAYAAVGVE